MDRVDVHRAQRVNFLIHAHRADFRRHRRTDAAGDQDGHHHRREFFGDGDADHAADGTGQTAFHQHRPGLQRDDRADEKGQDADHQQTGVADLKKLVKHLVRCRHVCGKASSVRQNSRTISPMFSNMIQARFIGRWRWS
jgi:hypothetical protein